MSSSLSTSDRMNDEEEDSDTEMKYVRSSSVDDISRSETQGTEAAAGEKNSHSVSVLRKILKLFQRKKSRSVSVSV